MNIDVAPGISDVAAWADDSDHRIPIIVGVTGHRDLIPADLDGIRERVRSFFVSLRSRFPHTPFQLYSGLAVGADQLVAQMAASCGIEVVPVLPVPVSIYVNDFHEDKEGLRTFEEFIAARSPIELQLHDDSTAEIIAADRSRTSIHSKRQYATLGNFLAVRCHVLLALWDGIECSEVGGTGFTVESTRKGRLEGDATLVDPIEGGLIYHVPVRRLRDPGARPARDDQFIAATPPEAFFAAFSEIDRYNAFPRAGSGGNTNVECAHGHADRLAMIFQRRVRRLRIAVFGCITTLISSYAVYSEYGHPQAALIVYCSTLALGAVIWFLDRQAAIEQRFLDYRTLAEAFRIQHIWTHAKVHLSVADYYLRKHRNELFWIRFALRGFASTMAIVELLRTRQIYPLPTATDFDRNTVETWMLEQREYFARAADLRERRIGVLRRVATGVYALGIVAALLALALPFSATLALREHEIILMMGLFPALAGTIGAWIKQTAIAEEAVHARAMKSLFGLALQEWIRPESRSTQAAIVRHLGVEALHENADWLALRRSRPIEAPLGSG